MVASLTGLHHVMIYLSGPSCQATLETVYCHVIFACDPWMEILNKMSNAAPIINAGSSTIDSRLHTAGPIASNLSSRRARFLL